MRFSFSVGLVVLLILLTLAAFVLWPQLDLDVSGWFAAPHQGFIWQNAAPLKALSSLVYYGARALGVVLLFGSVVALARRRMLLGLSGKAWLFLFFGLLLGPGLVANIVFKDNWGRARPREVTEFGGQAAFSPALARRQACDKNCSFVSGDASFGFFLPSFAYVVPLRRRRRMFWGGMGLGCLIGAARVIAGAHFLSDVLFAAFFMLLTSAALHGLMFGWKETLACWKTWLSRSK